MAWICGWTLVASVLCRAEVAEDPALAFERQVADMVVGPQVSVVHFWAPWCINCRDEMTPDGWAKFIEANPQVQFVFINIWHKGQSPTKMIENAKLGAQANLHLLTHPSPTRRRDDPVARFLGLPVTWLPTTWVFREGRLYYALNYGEVRFDILQVLVNDSQSDWKR